MFNIEAQLRYTRLNTKFFMTGRGFYNMEKIEVGEIFTLMDENDQEQEVEVLGAIELEDNQYIAVGFVEEIKEETDEEIDIFFLKVEEDGELSMIEDDEEFEKVTDAFDAMMDQEVEEE
jgi:uncharacterized protein YrzB (UPF0473 family)